MIEIEAWAFWLIAVVVVLLAIALVVVVATWFLKRGNPELRAIRKERQENERSSDRAALSASEQIASAFSVRREVRHTRRQLRAEQDLERHQRELDRLYRGEAEGGADIPEEPPEAPEH